MTNLVYICSAGHSGSTLLDMILGAHSAMASVGEMLLLPAEIDLQGKCTCGQEIVRCEIWSGVIDALSKSRGGDFRSHPEKLFLGYIHSEVRKAAFMTRSYKFKRIALNLLRYAKLRYEAPVPGICFSRLDRGLAATLETYELVRRHLHADVIIDSTKLYLRAVDLYLKNPSGTKIIVLTRDGRAVFNSFMRHGFTSEKSVAAWRNHYARALPLIDRYVDPSSVFHVKYEELVANPDKIIGQLCAWIGLPFEPSMLDFAAATHHNVNGNDARFNRSSTLKLDEKWRATLTKTQLQYFHRKAGGLNQRFGYCD